MCSSGSRAEDSNLDLSRRFRALDMSMHPQIHKRRSAAALIGAYMNLEEGPCTNSLEKESGDNTVTVEEVVSSAIFERKWSDKIRKLFKMLDVDDNGIISREEFLNSASVIKSGISGEEAKDIFSSADHDDSGEVSRILM
jgi:Ca2+-binding EF-hand superfamily protein